MSQLRTIPDPEAVAEPHRVGRTRQTNGLCNSETTVYVEAKEYSIELYMM